MNLKWPIRITGWVGLAINVVAIILSSTPLFLVGQILAVGSGALFLTHLQKEVTWDIWVSFAFTVWAAISQDPNWFYASLVVRSITYQRNAERYYLIEEELNEDT
jgi:hypothetical protein